MRRAWRWTGLLACVASVASAAPPVARRALPRPARSVEERCEGLPALKDRLPFGPGEKLSYVATVNGLRAGTADIEVQERTTRDGKLVYPAAVKATSNAVLSLWVRMDAELVTLVDPDGGLPLSMKSLTRGDNFVYEEDVRFSPVLGGTTTLKAARTELRLTALGDIVDSLSLVYYARTRDFAVGQRFCVELYQSRLLWRIRGVVERRESVDTDAGPLDAFVTTGEAVALGVGKGPALLKQPRPFSAWMTADEDRIPVLLKAPTPYGEVVARLTRFEQGRRLARPR